MTGAADMTYSTHTFATTTAGIFDWSAATGVASFKLPAVIGGTQLSGTSTVNLSAPIVVQNTNSSNNNTSITMGISSPGTSTGQTTLNVNCATTQGDCLDIGTGGTWASGALSGQTIVDAFTPTGVIKTGTAPTATSWYGFPDLRYGGDGTRQHRREHRRLCDGFDIALPNSMEQCRKRRVQRSPCSGGMVSPPLRPLLRKSSIRPRRFATRRASCSCRT